MVGMRLLLVPLRRAYRGLVWLANSPRTLIVAYLILIVVCGVIYSQVERDVTLGDAVWWAIVTASQHERRKRQERTARDDAA